MNLDPGHFFKICYFFNKAEFSNFGLFFFRLFLCLNLMNHSVIRKFLLSFFSHSSDSGFESKNVFFL